MPETPSNIVDQFGRVHDYLRISLTERCNLRCFYCMPAEGIPLRDKSHFMTIEEIEEITRTFVDLGVKKVRLTGGEPLVRKGVDKLIGTLGKMPVELGMTTNGILLDKHLNVMKEAGMKKVNISLDSLDKEKQAEISRRDCYDKIMDNIYLFLKEGFEVKVNMVLMKGVNDGEVIDFIKWTKNYPLSVRFIEFMPFKGNQWEWEKSIPEQVLLDMINQAFPGEVIRVADAPNDTARNFTISGYEGNFGMISTVSNPFCGTCNRIRLTADGKLKNCLFSQSETDLLTPYRHGNPLKKLILDAIFHKKGKRGGMDTLRKFSDTKKNQKNRSMITIGG